MAYTPIDNSGEHFKAVQYTGNSTEPRNIDVGFQSDFVWVKDGTVAYYARIFDSNRVGAGPLYPSEDKAEDHHNDGPEIDFSSPYSNGFKIIDNPDGTTNSYGVNQNGSDMISWNWKANGGTTSSNTSGNITSTVQANTDAGFSIVTYTDGGAGTRTVGHGLGKKPDIVLQKGRGSTQPWYMYINNDDITSLIAINLDVPNDWYTWNNGAAPTTTLFSQNYSGGNIVAYCWAAIEGYSQFGTYQGNNSTYGPFINTGFRPAFTLIKRTGTTGSWFMYDNKRDPFNPVDEGMFADGTWAESTQTNGMVDYLSNGFRIRNTGTSMNAASGAYFYWAFAESPFKYSNAK